MVGGVAKRDDELAEEIADTSIRNVGCERIEHEGPSQRIRKGFFQLICFEVFVSDTLLVDPYPLDSKSSIVFAEPSCVELIVWHKVEKDASNSHCQKACHKEYNPPRCNSRAMTLSTDSDAIRQQSAENLCPSVEAEPYAYSCPLFFLGVPLGGKKSKSGGNGCFKDSQEEAYSDGAGIALHSRHAGENKAPHYDTERGVFGQR